MLNRRFITGSRCPVALLSLVFLASVTVEHCLDSTALHAAELTGQSGTRAGFSRHGLGKAESGLRPVIGTLHHGQMKRGQAVEVHARVVRPSALPDNARVRVDLLKVPSETLQLPPNLDGSEVLLSKTLHALDADFFTVFAAPEDGYYRMLLTPEEGEVDVFAGDRWREAGQVDELLSTPRSVQWPAGAMVDVELGARPIDSLTSRDGVLTIEAEPNNSPIQAQPVPLRDTADDYKLQVVGTSDDIEYFDNGKVGTGHGDDWLRLEFNGPESRLLTACLTIPDQQVAARIRCYTLPADKATDLQAIAAMDLNQEYETGKNENERVHQQQEQHRIAINRTLNPGNVYFLRVEANAPGYGLELRILKPAPFADPRQAVRHAMYDHIGQVSSWLNNRPRGASVERRIRDTGNLLGTMCMSCHTHSGVWGPSIPFTMGYRAENQQLFRNLTNLCYQSMRPCNELVQAGNNTSLAPLDIGDGPAGTRVAGHSVVSLERFLPPRHLQSGQHLRAANFILQTADPGGINAAGPGANVGQSVVFNYAGEVVYEAWKKTGSPWYFRALEDKVRRMLDVDPKYTDDMAHRVELLSRYFPADYLEQAKRVREIEDSIDAAQRFPSRTNHRTTDEEAEQLVQRIRQTVQADLARLRAIQHESGTWGFNPGVREGDQWKVDGNNNPEPSPTALALIALQAAGYTTDDPTVARGVQGLLSLQHPTGYWKGQSQTGFVSTSYALHALSRLHPVDAPRYVDADFAAADQETLPDTINRIRRLALIDDAVGVDELVAAARHDSPLVRFQAMIGLGARHCDDGVGPLADGLGDYAKPVRVAAHWGFRQTLIDDRGWPDLLAACRSDDDYVRDAAMQALLMRVDGVMPGIGVEWSDLTAALAHGINSDAHPAVRAWALRAAWNWWIWNPPVREALNKAWIERLQFAEPNTLVENAIRYQSHSLFIANGHKANSSSTHQYAELAELFKALEQVLRGKASSDPERRDPQVAARMAERLVSTGATFYNTSGGDGGPGQMGYVTPGAADLFGFAAMHYFKTLDDGGESLTGRTDELMALRVGLEGSANVTYDDLQQRLIQFSLEGPEVLRPIAAASVSDPRSAQLVAVPERIEPLMKQVHRGATEPDRRPQLSDPIIKMFGTITWIIPDTTEQKREVFGYLMPEFGDYLTGESVKAIADASLRADTERRVDANWYLARQLGDAIGNNPDLHTDVMIEFFPQAFEHPQVARFWLPSVEWLMTHRTSLPEVTPGKLPPIDPLEEIRTRALQLLLDQLTEAADPDTRRTAVVLAQKTALRRNPEVLTSLEKMLAFEKRDDVVRNAQNVLKQNRDSFVTDLTVAVKAEEPAITKLAGDQLPQEFVEDFVFFRDYVTPEMNRVLRGDQRSCFACHGVKGRVPSLELHRPDEAGYLPVDQLLSNYRVLQKRVNHGDVERSLLLRKPLNVQTGAEEGHQGGRRYQPTDPGYQILRNWVLNQVKLEAAE